jgi:isopentenyl-diphosphate delta-isomerase
LREDREINLRKLEHINIVLEKNVDYPDHCTEIYESIILIHQGFPGVDYDEIDLTTRFLDYELRAPVMITGMTGGHPDTRDINEKIAKLALEYGVAVGVGSQRPMLINRSDEIVETYRIVRRTVSREIPVVGNIGLNTLNDISVDDIEYLIEQLEADALAIHLNPGQELIQPEGDTRFNMGVIDKLGKILDRIDVPVIIKEVGTGLSIETVRTFYEIGIRYFDVAGACGTNWILVEMYRSRTTDLKRDIASLLRNWGIPTPLSVIETRYAAPDSYIIASGGVWDGVKAVKNLVLGADLVGLAKPIIKHILLDYGKAREYLERFIGLLKAVMFLIGARRIEDLTSKPVVILDPVKTYLEQRGIDVKKYVTSIRGGGRR